MYISEENYILLIKLFARVYIVYNKFLEYDCRDDANLVNIIIGCFSKAIFHEPVYDILVFIHNFIGTVSSQSFKYHNQFLIK